MRTITQLLQWRISLTMSERESSPQLITVLFAGTVDSSLQIGSRRSQEGYELGLQLKHVVQI